MYQVALFGATGCGKSSIINLLTDKPVANVSESVEACTRRARWFPASVGEKTFRLWDTTGFNQVKAKDVDPLSPYEQAHALLQNLQDGVDLILLCARKDGLDASLGNLYWLLDNFFFGGRARIALVFTHFDMPDEDWWDHNVDVITERCSIPARSLPHACITAIQVSQSGYTYELSKHTLRALLQEHATSSTKLPDLSSGTTVEDVAESLRSHCQLNLLDAKTLVERFRLPRRPFRVVLFGETGTGKSSVINLIVGKSVASVSSRIEGCTLSSCCYEINTGSHQFLVWDTVGFSGNRGRDATAMAFRDATRLFHSLHGTGGVDLLVFCKKGGRMSRLELSCFWFFQEFLCKGRIPVAFIITHLESHSPMETWWEMNGEDLVSKCNLRMSAVAGHACITAAQDDLDDHKCSLSRELVQTMLEDSISRGNALNHDEGIWAMSFLKNFVEMVKGCSTRKDKIPVMKLVNRCGLTREQANELVRLLNSQGQLSRFLCRLFIADLPC